MKARIIKPPNEIILDEKTPSIFLAGSIEMGVAEDWQSRFEKALNHYSVTILNPRREQWDATWEQTIENQVFRKQVEWELEAQEKANLIAMYFVPETKSPITLLELGLFAHSNKLLVCCPDGFWRKGNVDIVCKRYNIDTVSSLEELIIRVKTLINL
jgi:hypothetical protein